MFFANWSKIYVYNKWNEVVIFRGYIFLSWRQKNWQQQLNRPENSRQQQTFVDHVSSKEEVSKWDLSTKRDPEEESLYDSIQPESTDTYWDIDYVQLRKVVRDKFSTLTTLFKTHSYDVENTVSKLTPKEPDKWIGDTGDIGYLTLYRAMYKRHVCIMKMVSIHKFWFMIGLYKSDCPL